MEKKKVNKKDNSKNKKTLKNNFSTFLKIIEDYFLDLTSSLKKLNNWKSMKKNDKVTILSFFTVLFFLITVVVVSISLNSVFGRHQSKIRYIEEDGIKYIGVKDGFITEKLIVESGDLLPSIINYFSQNSTIPEDVSITYYMNSIAVPVENFTYEVDDKYFVRGIGDIDVLIKSKNAQYKTKLHIQDTTEPSVELKDISIKENEELDPNTFVVLYNDNTQLTDYSVSIIGDVDYSNVGEYEVNLNICDSANNCIQNTAKLIVEKSENYIVTIPPSSSTGNSGNSNNENNNNNSGNSNSNSENSGNNNSGNSNSENKPNKEPEKRIFLREVTESNVPIKTEKNYYGAKYNLYARNYTYKLYSDGYKEPVSYDSTYRGWDRSGYNADISAMNKEVDAFQAKYGSAITDIRTYYWNNTNKLREGVGAGSLILDAHLCRIAQLRLLEIVNTELYLDANLVHQRPDGRQFKTIFYEYKYGLSNSSWVGENMTYGTGGYSSDRSFADFKKSPAHYNAMINPEYKRMGVGVYYSNSASYYLQLFVS